MGTDSSSLAAAPTLWQEEAVQVTPQSKPLLKWPGGKRAIVSEIKALIPAEFGHYYECFAGGAALFFALTPPHAVLSDKCEELINCYIAVRDHADDVIDALSRLRNSPADFYEIRSYVPSNKISRAARLIYLVTLSFNGMYRENAKGMFNVPYGYRPQRNPCDPVRIQSVSAALANTELLHADFEDALAGAKSGDVIYLDPPYTVAHGNNGFVQYNARIFSWEDQRRLASRALRLAAQGCTVIVSNADHPSISALYTQFDVRIVSRASKIAASSKARGKTTECIFYNAQR